MKIFKIEFNLVAKPSPLLSYVQLCKHENNNLHEYPEQEISFVLREQLQPGSFLCKSEDLVNDTRNSSE